MPCAFAGHGYGYRLLSAAVDDREVWQMASFALGGSREAAVAVTVADAEVVADSVDHRLQLECTFAAVNDCWAVGFAKLEL